jgi:2'-5' RNA ligase/GNAT superfamily N-acetyltransferase
MPRRRLGVALLLPAPVAHEVDGLRGALGDGALGVVAPHVTLISPVNVAEADLPHALAVVRAAAAATAPLTLELGPVRTFLPVSPVAYLSVDGPVAELHERLHTGPFGRPLTNPFVPHVTVADDLPEDRLAAAVTALSEVRRTVVVDHVHVLQQQSGVWAPIAGVALGPPAVVGRGGLELVLEVHDRPPPDALDLGVGPDPADLVVVARRDEGVVGVTTGRLRGTKAWLEQLVVAEAGRHQGVGGHLLASFLALAAERGATRALARTGGDDGFLARHGWVPDPDAPLVRRLDGS